ncbi:hypothetical protein [Corynebacterium sp. 335C]
MSSSTPSTAITSATGTSGGGSGSGGRRGLFAVLAVVLVAVIGAAVWLGRGDGGSGGGDVTVVKAVIGSEKKPFFDDAEVTEVLRDRGYEVSVDTAGSREIADVDLSSYDLAFPSSAPAADRIRERVDEVGAHSPFFSPLVVASWTPIAELLEREGVASRGADGHWRIDMQAYLELTSEGRRWRDLPGADGVYPSPSEIRISSTDVRTSNSAAMYLALMSWVANGGGVVTGPAQIEAAVDEVAPLFVGQGYAQSSSAGPFRDYVSQGIGSKPMVMIYESQFLGRSMDERGKASMTDEMVLMYPEPTIQSTHTAVSLTEEGDGLARLLAEDPELQRLAARHGFRPYDGALLREELEAHGIAPTPEVITAVDAPDHATLEALIEGVAARFGAAPPPRDDDGAVDDPGIS